jgi:hypothetical protein
MEELIKRLREFRAFGSQPLATARMLDEAADHIARLEAELAAARSSAHEWKYWGEAGHEIYDAVTGTVIGRAASEGSAMKIIEAHNAARQAEAQGEKNG